MLLWKQSEDASQKSFWNQMSLPLYLYPVSCLVEIKLFQINKVCVAGAVWRKVVLQYQEQQSYLFELIYIFTCKIYFKFWVLAVKKYPAVYYCYNYYYQNCKNSLCRLKWEKQLFYKLPEQPNKHQRRRKLKKNGPGKQSTVDSSLEATQRTRLKHSIW